ncbi:hypothetical protein M0R72_07170 [Candidatus Pacearchaeota archaeon]|jgi:hypothetical protein|nr:hypothetical protein [Candidatus Pacearchaeota archaeon]
MSKFHEEFFKAGSPKHDKLMIKTLSEDGIKRVLDAIDIDTVVYNDRKRQLYLNEKYTVCERSDKTMTIYSGWSDGYNREIPTIGYDNRCNFYGCSCQSICTKTIRQIEAKPTLENISVKHSYETEVIARSGNFIIGYADAIIRSLYSGDVCVDLGYSKPYVKGQFELQADTLIEAKPELNSIGDVLRQLKTYNSLLRRTLPNRSVIIPMRMVITTYTELDKDSLDYLEHEGVKVVTFA